MSLRKKYNDTWKSDAYYEMADNILQRLKSDGIGESPKEEQKLKYKIWEIFTQIKEFNTNVYRINEQETKIRNNADQGEFFPGIKLIDKANISDNIYNRLLPREGNLLRKQFLEGEWKTTIVPKAWTRTGALMGAQSQKQNCFTVKTILHLANIVPLHGTENPNFPEAIKKGKKRAKAATNPQLWKIIQDGRRSENSYPVITIDMMQNNKEFAPFKSEKPMEVISSWVKKPVRLEDDEKEYSQNTKYSYILDGVGRLVNLQRGLQNNKKVSLRDYHDLRIEVLEFQCTPDDWRKTIKNIHKLRAIDGLCQSPISFLKQTITGLPCVGDCEPGEEGISPTVCPVHGKGYRINLEYSDCCGSR